MKYLQYLKSRAKYIFHFVMLALSAYCLMWFTQFMWTISVHGHVVLLEPNKTIILTEFLIGLILMCYVMLLAVANYWRAFK